MTESKAEKKSKGPFINPWLGNVMVPIAIVLLGALLTLAVSALLSPGHTPRDLVREMRSKTFGNRWIAAYELAKFISSSAIAQEEIPWIIDNLAQTMRESSDPRTRKFIVVALGALGDLRALPTLEEALSDEDGEVRFHTVVAIGQSPTPKQFDWQRLERLLNSSSDLGLLQVTLLTLATHRVPSGQAQLIRFLNHQNPTIRFSAATGLINYREEKAIPVLKEILFLSAPKGQETMGFDLVEIKKLKLNVVMALSRNSWKALRPLLEQQLEQEANLQVVGKIKELLDKWERPKSDEPEQNSDH